MEKLQFISQETQTYSHLDSIKKACEAGVKWIQLRVKDQPEAVILDIALKAKNICENYNAKLIINDHPSIAFKIKAHGVHVGKEDMSVKEARKLLGNDFIIGGTANTFEDIEKHYSEGADYVGVGPFRFTTTKKKLSPILGSEGYSAIIEKLQKKDISIPVIAIGGIELTDINSILLTGVHGIAVSSLIANSDNSKETVMSIFKSINDSISTTTC